MILYLKSVNEIMTHDSVLQWIMLHDTKSQQPL